MAWSTSDWEPWVTLVGVILATTLLTLLASYYYRRRKTHRFSRVEVIDGRPKSVVIDSYSPTAFPGNALATTPTIVRAAVQIDRELSDGRFGKRYLGSLLDHADPSTAFARTVEILELNTGKYDRTKLAFQAESDMLGRVSHYNIARLVGMVADSPRWLLVEHASYGSLYDVMARHRDASAQIDQSEIVHLATQLASALAYLHAEGLSHNAICSRACKLTKRNRLLLADFASGWQVTSSLWTVMEQKRMDAYRNLSPEVMLHWGRAVGPAADTWSFGMTIIELCLQAAAPLMQEVRRDELLPRLQDGFRPERPSLCTPDLYTLVQPCWNGRPDARPTMAVLHAQLRDMSAALDALATNEYREIGVVTLAHKRVSGSHHPVREVDPYAVIAEPTTTAATNSDSAVAHPNATTAIRAKAYDPYDMIDDDPGGPAPPKVIAIEDPYAVAEAKRQAEAAKLYSTVTRHPGRTANGNGTQSNGIIPGSTGNTPDDPPLQQPELPDRAYRRNLSTDFQLRQFLESDPSTNPTTTNTAWGTPPSSPVPSLPSSAYASRRTSATATHTISMRPADPTPWLHPTASRREAQTALMSRGMMPGLFLVRPSKGVGYVLMVADGTRYRSYRITIEQFGTIRSFSLDGETRFATLNDLIEYYMEGHPGAEKLQDPLRVPCASISAYKHTAPPLAVHFEETEI